MLISGWQLTFAVRSWPRGHLEYVMAQRIEQVVGHHTDGVHHLARRQDDTTVEVSELNQETGDGMGNRTCKLSKQWGTLIELGARPVCFHSEVDFGLTKSLA